MVKARCYGVGEDAVVAHLEAVDLSVECSGNCGVALHILEVTRAGLVAGEVECFAFSNCHGNCHVAHVCAKLVGVVDRHFHILQCAHYRVNGHNVVGFNRKLVALALEVGSIECCHLLFGVVCLYHIVTHGECNEFGHIAVDERLVALCACCAGAVYALNANCVFAHVF